MGIEAAPGDYARGFAAMYRFQTGRSPSVGWFATTSQCFANSERFRQCDPGQMSENARPHPRLPTSSIAGSVTPSEPTCIPGLGCTLSGR